MRRAYNRFYRAKDHMTEHISYQGRTVEVFGYAPTGQPIPVLPADVEGENVGDQAFIAGVAMHWDGESWVPSPWKDFAAWRTPKSQP